MWAKASGAIKIDAIDPAGAGSGGAWGTNITNSDNILNTLRSGIIELGYTNIDIHECSFQDFEHNGDKYDIIFLSNSINHLDEEACINFKYEKTSKQKYRLILKKYLI